MLWLIYIFINWNNNPERHHAFLYFLSGSASRQCGICHSSRWTIRAKSGLQLQNHGRHGDMHGKEQMHRSILWWSLWQEFWGNPCMYSLKAYGLVYSMLITYMQCCVEVKCKVGGKSGLCQNINRTKCKGGKFHVGNSSVCLLAHIPSSIFRKTLAIFLLENKRVESELTSPFFLDLSGRERCSVLYRKW